MTMSVTRRVVLPNKSMRITPRKRAQRVPTWGNGTLANETILAPDGSYLAGPLYDEEGILYAELDPARLDEERQRFDPAGHYHRPDVLGLRVSPGPAEATTS